MSALAARLDLRAAGRTAAGVVLSVALIVVVLLLLGADPVRATTSLLRGALGSPFGIGETLAIASVLLLAGLAAAVPFSAGLWNIGGEGQMDMGAVAAAAVAFEAPAGLPRWLHVSLCMLAGVLGGALWGFVPGILKTRFGANEVITTLMLVYVAMFAVDGAISHLWPSRAQTTPPIPASAEAAPVVAGRVAELAGGIVVVRDGRVVAEVALPVFGLLSDAPLAETVAACQAVARAVAEDLGCPDPDVLTNAAFATLPRSIPELKVSDHGLVRVFREGPRELVPLEV